MGLNVGDTVLGRFRVESELRPMGELFRWAAVDPEGNAVEVCAPSPSTMLRPEMETFFLETHRRLLALTDAPALLPVLAVGQSAAGPTMVRPRVTAWPEDAQIPAAHGPQALGWLAHTTQKLGAQLGGHLNSSQLVIDTDGVARIAPTGVAAAHSLSDVSPTRSQKGFGNAGRDALFGLGVLLFSALAGRPPFEGKTPNKLARAQLVPLELSGLMAQPLGWDTSSLQRLLTDADAQVSPDPSSHPPWIPSFDWPESTLSTQSPMRVGAPEPPLFDGSHKRWLVVAELENTTRVARRRLAALADIPTTLLEKGGDFPVGGGQSEEEAADVRAQLAKSGVPLSIASNRTGTRNLVFGVVGGVVGLSMLGVGASLGLLVLPAVPVLMGSAAIIAPIFGWSGWQIWRGFQRNAETKVLRQKQRRMPQSDESDPIRDVRSEIGQTRRAVLLGDLPQIAITDLNQALDDLEDSLDALQTPSSEQLSTLRSAAEAIRHSIARHAPQSDWNDAPLRRAHLVAKALRRTRQGDGTTG